MVITFIGNFYGQGYLFHGEFDKSLSPVAKYIRRWICIKKSVECEKPRKCKEARVMKPPCPLSSYG